MEEQVLQFNRERIKTELGIEEANFNALLQELSLEEFQDFSQEQFQLIAQYNYLIENDYKGVIEDEIGKTGINRQEITRRIYQELELEKENDALKLKTKYTLKTINKEIEEKLERPVKLSELAIILELSNLSLEDEYTEEQKQAIDKGLIQYLNRKSKESSPLSDEEDLKTVIEEKSVQIAEEMSETIAETIAEAKTQYDQMIKKAIPQGILLQLSRLDREGILDKKIELAREKIAQQNRLHEKPTTIEIALNNDGQKQLPMKSASVEENGTPQG